MQYISLAFRINFREFCVDLYLRQIDDVFRNAGINCGVLSPNVSISGERRTRVEEYYASIDWTSPKDAERFLTVVSLVLAQSYLSGEQRDALLNHYLCIIEDIMRLTAPTAWVAASRLGTADASS